MNQAVQFLMNHGVAVLFIAVLAEQAGLPIPSVSLLLAFGSLASLGRMSLTISIGVALLACLMADLFWYQVGRRSRSKFLRKSAERSLRRENRMRCTLGALSGHRAGVLSLAKFLPGPNLASPLAGMSGLTRSRFLILDSVASVIWAGGYIAVGYTCSKQLQRITANGSGFGAVLLVVGACVCSVLHRRQCPHLRRDPTKLCSWRCGRREELEELEPMLDGRHGVAKRATAGREVLLQSQHPNATSAGV